MVCQLFATPLNPMGTDLLEAPDQSSASLTSWDRLAPMTIDCSFRNGSDRMVILRCCGPEQFFLERVVFPFEILSFSCPPHSEVEIWTHGLGGPELLESIQAEELQIAETEQAPGALPLPENPWYEAS